ncbi:hypothetical protein DFP72DRAFT_1008758 [Ephemerocybe angulata]|uniref:DUF6533 domain-containing protein n=1 Tax=Ephemerocybe angulata TaxID=980116 RepID=A0A8H6M5D3_9AGAR|nr:hypothetical protein DFP72DRAFT_1008758 [Tulosesus angulatus]
MVHPNYSQWVQKFFPPSHTDASISRFVQFCVQYASVSTYPPIHPSPSTSISWRTYIHTYRPNSRIYPSRHPKHTYAYSPNDRSAPAALIYYDWVLTFEREVKYIWRRPASIAMVLVVFCRYSLVANVVFALGLVDKLNGKGVLRALNSRWWLGGRRLTSPLCRCDFAYVIAAALSLLGRLGILAILGARTCAMFQHNKYMVAFFSLLGLAVMGLAIAHVPYVSCTGNGRKPPKPSPGDVLSIMTVIYELLSTICLAYGCLRSMKKTAPTGRGKSKFGWDTRGLVFLMLREGLLYTGFVSLFTTSAMILVYTTKPGSFAQRSLNALTLPISGMMTVRFLLHLREWQKGSAEFTATEFHHSPTALEFMKNENEDGVPGNTFEKSEVEAVEGWRGGMGTIEEVPLEERGGRGVPRGLGA